MHTLSEMNKKSCIKSKGLTKEIVNLPTHTVYVEILTVFFIWLFGSFGFKPSN